MIKLFKRKQKQSTFCHCPRCNNELVSSNSFVADRDGIVEYRCNKCGEKTFWDFARYPVPYLRTCSDCHYLIDDGMGNPYCPKQMREHRCSPSTQRLFIDKAIYCDYCMGSKPLIIGDTNDQGICIMYPNKLNAYGYDVHGFGSNALLTTIKYCPMCGRLLKN